ncbi:MAG: aminotransferase class I/II-fold pyridoxal phosphate-dependent enzyme [Clostridia bacterium]|nr:aminotransferase class I/II-fold pyridoxal phosphate-dependent enzyme [Clostridia bacterium]
MKYCELSREELLVLKDETEKRYIEFKRKNLVLDMSRGKPNKEQLDLTMDMLDCMKIDSYDTITGIDSRNYGCFEGIPEARKIMGDLLGVDSNNVIIGGASSLNLMFDYVTTAMLKGVCGHEPWSKQGKVKFLCPVPGYDRHFAICEYLGIEMINIPMLDNGPDVELITELVKDSSVKGMFCVPKYSNPEGKVFSDKVVKALAELKPAAPDFRIIWDNAYCVHHLGEHDDELLNIIEYCAQVGNPDIVIEVTSTSKISFPGSGISCIAASDNNIKDILSRMKIQTICNNNINQLRHVKYFGSAQGIREHMNKHAAILRPRFDIVLEMLENELAELGIAKWGNPKGGYFISLDVMDGCAKRVCQLSREAGVVLTNAGATFPYGIDPNDRNIRIAPSFPSVEDLRLASELLCISVKLAVLEKMLTK